MQYNFCTFFNKRFLFHGLALYNSLERHVSDFKLWVLCMDDETFNLLMKLSLKNVVLVSMQDFEDPELLAVKNEATRDPYGTVKPSFVLYLLQKNPNLKSLLYLDSDIFCFSSPIAMYTTFDSNSDATILLTPHRFLPNEEYRETRNGRFNNGIMGFKNNEIVLNCLQEWREECIRWCENRVTSGFYSNQKYMDKWPTKFEGVYILKDKGVNLGPWNVSQYKIHQKDNALSIDQDPLIFYHFSSFRVYSPKSFLLFDYAHKLSCHVRKIIYKPYLVEMKKVIAEINHLEPSFLVFDTKPPFWKYLKYKIVYNLVKIHIYLKEMAPLYSNIFHKYIKKQ